MASALEHRRRIKARLAKAAEYFYIIFVRPKSPNEDEAGRELILNIIVSVFLCVLIFFLLVVITEYAWAGYSEPYINPLLFFILFFSALMALSRRRHVVLAKYLLVGIFFLGTTYAIFTWGIEMPVAVLFYGLTIVITSVVAGSAFALALTVLVAAVMMTIGYLEAHGIIMADLSWEKGPVEMNYAIEMSLLYFFAMIISWLSRREIKRSLDRARTSEEMLRRERDLLELKIEDRTKELKAAQLEKMAQLYRFVEFGRHSSGIFHDLLSPLAAVSLTVEKLRDEKHDMTGEWKEHIERALRASKRIESFVQTAKKQLDSEGKKEIFALENEISDAVDFLLHKSRIKGVEIKWQAGGTTLVYGNSVKFFQIVANLVSNAIDSYEGLALPAAEKTIDIRIDKSLSGFKLVVRDNGCGIPQVIQETIFEPFFTTKPKQAGMGLGLSTTKTIVEKDFGGTIRVESEPGKGSTFVVTIPIERRAEDRRRRAK